MEGNKHEKKAKNTIKINTMYDDLINKDKDYIDNEIKKREEQFKDYLNKNPELMASLAAIQNTIKDTFERLSSQWEKSVQPAIKYMEENKEAFDLLSEWPKITGLTMEELDQMAVWEVVELVNEKLAEKLPQIVENELIENYCILPNSPITKFIKNVSIAKSNTKAKNIAKSKNVKIQETIDYEGGRGIYDYITTNESYEIIFEELKALKTRQSISLRKTMNFILIKANEQNKPRTITFNLEDYQNMTGYKSKDTAYRGAVRNFEILRGISVGGVVRRGKKEVRNKTSYIFIAKDITYNQCVIECKPELVELLSQYYTLLPIWAGELNTKAYDLLDYIFYMARQSQNLKNIKDKNIFNVSLKSINENIGGHDPDETQRHTEYIINPILDAIEEIEETQAAADRTNIKITPIYNHDYKNAYDFLEGYLEIELDDEALNYYIDRNAARIKEVKKALANSKKNNKN
jgi:hypothetical protein